MNRRLAAALAALLPVVASLSPATAQQPIAPDTPGAWGFAYSDLADGQEPRALAARDAISCLAEPALVVQAAEGYVLNAYRVDLQALAGGELRYFVQFENLCSYDPASGLETCRRIAAPDDANLYRTWYEPLDVAAGIYRAHAFASPAEFEAFQATGQPPETAQGFVVFPCPADQQPDRALLRSATRDDAQSQKAYEAMIENFRLCNAPICGADLDRLRGAGGG